MLYKTIFRVGLCGFLLTVVCYSAAETAASDMVEVNEVETAPTRSTGNSKDRGTVSEVIITLGDKKLTMQQVNWMQPNANDSQIARIADWWLKNKLLYAEAEKRGLTNEPKAKFFAELMRKNAFRNELVTRVQDAVKIDDESVLAYYEKNKETDPRLSQPGYLSFSHVRTKTVEEAQTVLERIKAGENINELARKLSIYGDAKRGGVVKKYMYRTVERRLGPKFFEAITTAKEGELIGPIKVEKDGSYEVAIKTGEIKPTPIPFEEVKNGIKSRLERTEKDKAFRSLLDSLKKEAADKIVKSSRLIEAEKTEAEKSKTDRPTPPKHQPEPTSPK